MDINIITTEEDILIPTVDYIQRHFTTHVELECDGKKRVFNYDTLRSIRRTYPNGSYHTDYFNELGHTTEDRYDV